MPGIVGYVGRQAGAPIVIGGLRQLEYRGYDSAGIAVQEDGGAIVIRRATGKLSALTHLRDALPLHGHTALGHTRWATHGRPSEINAHPHGDCRGAIVVVHAGIIENFQSIQAALIAEGHEFRSETDTEVLPHLIEQRLREGAPDVGRALRAVLHDLPGAHTLLVMSAHEPGRLWAARVGPDDGLIVGYGDGEMFVASDQLAILEHTRTMAYLEPDELAVLSADDAHYTRLDGRPVDKITHTIAWDPTAAARRGYRHFTQKEIYEQPDSLANTLRGRLDATTGAVYLEEVRYRPAQLRAFKRILILGAGSSWYSALAGRWMFETLTHLPVEVDSATEFRYHDPPLDKSTLVLAVTQSGKTGDTLAAMDLARKRGAHLLGLVNVLDSPAERLAEGVVYMHAGPELGVAATKSFTCSLVDQALLAVALGWSRGSLSEGRAGALAAALAALPDQVRGVLADDEPYGDLARAYAGATSLLYIGRGALYPVALQGAHILKQIAYLHAEGLPAGELVHGARALLDPGLPVVALALRNALYPVMHRTIEELKAHDANVLAIATVGDTAIADVANQVIYVPPTDPVLEPVLAVLPLQLLAYEMAIRRGCDVDQPRHLAKTVGEE